MIIVTTDQVVGKEVKEVKGLVQGSTVQSKHVGRDIGAAFKTFVGGEIRGYSDLMRQARKEAIQRMEEEAKKIGANAIVAMRFQTAQIMDTAAEVTAYGTAIVIE